MARHPPTVNVLPVQMVNFSLFHRIHRPHVKSGDSAAKDSGSQAELLQQAIAFVALVCQDHIKILQATRLVLVLAVLLESITHNTGRQSAAIAALLVHPDNTLREHAL
eukprot:TRINITY_DN10527_c0_g1_i3.p5 TRINITY_DN10527_c0_g1~~TRINITY_DN10527_c0_g1_i3.p5  ORF type:complete len:108 (+),score=6.07 TRINITY_DN10527_c0_g1_i3:473-796(+)